jgi:hypothetical protein
MRRNGDRGLPGGDREILDRGCGFHRTGDRWMPDRWLGMPGGAPGGGGGTLADGDPVSSWPDSSGNGHAGTQSGSSRPIYKTNVVNGKPVLRFAAANSTTLNITSPILGQSPWTALYVIKPPNNSTELYAIGSAPGGGLYAAGFGGDGNIYAASRDMAGAIGGGSLYASFTVFTTIATLTPSLTVYGNGTSLGFSASGSPNSSDFARIVNITSTGDVAEIILYNVALGSTDRANIEKYLGVKYGITVAGGSAVDPSTVSGLVGWWKADSLLAAGGSFDPSTIAGLKLWLKADSLALSDGATVGTWASSGPDGNSASTTLGAPKFKTNIVNGKPVVRFTSAGTDGMVLATNITTTPGWTVCVVMRPLTLTSDMVSLARPGNDVPLGPIQNPTDVYIGLDSTTSYYKAVGGNVAGFHVYTGNTSPAVYLDGVSRTLNQIVANNSSTYFSHIGLRGSPIIYSDGDIAEILCYDSVLSTTDRQNVENYLKTKYGIP